MELAADIEAGLLQPGDGGDNRGAVPSSRLWFWWWTGAVETACTAAVLPVVGAGMDVAIVVAGLQHGVDVAVTVGCAYTFYCIWLALREAKQAVKEWRQERRREEAMDASASASNGGLAPGGCNRN